MAEPDARLPRLLVTGASGFIGRHLLDSLKEEWRIVGLARRTQARSGAPVHPNITWHQVDIGDALGMAKVFRRIKEEGTVDVVVHLAAHYDFTGEEHPEYWRTNVDGLRNVLDHCRALEPKRFIFSSSTAACAFPRRGEALNEDSPPDGDHLYARTKAIGERMLEEYADDFPSVIVRFAALFSDWCEYPPLYMFLRTWLSSAWNSRILGGRGESAIPYLHVRDGVRFLRAVLRRHAKLENGEVLIASPDGDTDHRSLFETSTFLWFEQTRRPICIPRPLVKPGIVMRDLLGRFMTERPFERPWMANYLDLRMTIDASRTRAKLGWAPRERLGILRRLPFLLENMKGDQVEWTRRNRDAMKQVRLRPCIRIYNLLQQHRDEIKEECSALLQERFVSYRCLTSKDLQWNHGLLLNHLFTAVRTRERLGFLTYCEDLAARRFDEGFDVEEVAGAMETIERVCAAKLEADPESHEILPYIHQHLTMTMRFGIDQVYETFEDLAERAEAPV